MSTHQESRQYTRTKIRWPKTITMSHILLDNSGRRMGIERRQFSYTAHIPERRSGKDGRSVNDRRQKLRT
jgi:hypothetical protein